MNTELVKFEFLINGDKSEIPNIGPKSDQNLFEAEISVISEAKEVEKIEFRIHSSLPFSKNDYKKILNEKFHNLLTNKIKVTKILTEGIESISFYESIILGLGLSSKGKDGYGTTTLKLDQITIIREIERSKEQCAIFFLTDSSLRLLYQIYSFKVDHKNPKWEAKNELGTIDINDLKINFGLQFSFDSQEINKTEINKIPYLEIGRIKSRTLLQDYLKYFKTIMSILSFERGENIDFYFCRILDKNKEYHTYRVVKNISHFDDVYFGLRPWGFDKKFYELLSLSDFNKIVRTQDSFRSCITRLFLSKNMIGESKFLILYNILEQLKNTYGRSSQDISFSFDLTKKETNEFILNTLEQITGIVKEVERDEFKDHIKNHIKTVKYKKMKNQFLELFKIYLPSYNLTDLVPIIKMRNEIFHSGSAEDYNKLIEMNKKLAYLIRKLLLNIILTKEDSASNKAQNVNSR